MRSTTTFPNRIAGDAVIVEAREVFFSRFTVKPRSVSASKSPAICSWGIEIPMRQCRRWCARRSALHHRHSADDDVADAALVQGGGEQLKRLAE